jgi:AcrB/AcrD/AcrF family
MSAVAISNTPTDIFPNINIPVVAVDWTYTGLNPEELEGRLTSVYVRVLTATVDNIQHIESTTVNGQAIVKIFLQPTASLDTANAQITAVSQTILRHLPSGTLPPLIINYSASSVPILQLGRTNFIRPCCRSTSAVMIRSTLRSAGEKWSKFIGGSPGYGSLLSSRGLTVFELDHLATFRSRIWRLCPRCRRTSVRWRKGDSQSGRQSSLR